METLAGLTRAECISLPRDPAAVAVPGMPGDNIKDGKIKEASLGKQWMVPGWSRRGGRALQTCQRIQPYLSFLHSEYAGTARRTCNAGFEAQSVVVACNLHAPVCA